MAGTRRKVKANLFKEQQNRRSPVEKRFERPDLEKFNDPQPTMRGTGYTGLSYEERRVGEEERRGHPDNRKRQLGTKTTSGTKPAFEVTNAEFKGIPKPGRAKVLKSTKETKFLKDRRRKDRRE
ncbi:MAG: hypothetical protein ABH828_02480 [archaeon]